MGYVSLLFSRRLVTKLVRQRLVNSGCEEWCVTPHADRMSNWLSCDLPSRAISLPIAVCCPSCSWASRVSDIQRARLRCATHASCTLTCAPACTPHMCRSRLVRSLFSCDLVPNCCVLSLVVLGVARERYTARAPQEYTCTSKVFTTQYYKSKQYILLLVREPRVNFYKLSDQQRDALRAARTPRGRPPLVGASCIHYEYNDPCCCCLHSRARLL